MATRPGLCQIAKETASAAPTLCTEYAPNGWMDGWMDCLACHLFPDTAHPDTAHHHTNKSISEPLQHWKDADVELKSRLTYDDRRMSSDTLKSCQGTQNNASERIDATLFREAAANIE